MKSPRLFNSLATRIALTLIGGLVLVQVLGFLILSQERHRWLGKAQIGLYTMRLNDLLVALDNYDEKAFAELEIAGLGPRVTVLGPEERLAAQPPSDDRDNSIIDNLRTALAAARPGADLQVRRASAAAGPLPLWMPPPLMPSRPPFGDDIGEPPRGPPPGSGPDRHFPMHDSFAGPDAGSEFFPPPVEREAVPIFIDTVNARGVAYRLGFRMPPMNPMRLPKLVLTPLVLTGLALTLLAVVAAQWVVRPLRRLADAADALGRDLRSAPLPEDGPAEVALAARTFNRMQERLLRFVQGRADALAAMSHDLRTPITRIRLRAEMLPDQERLGLAQDIAEVDDMIERTLGFMRGIDEQEPEQSLEPQALVAEAVEGLRHLAHPIGIGSVTPHRFPGSPGLLRRALVNLLENAVKYAQGVEIEAVSDGREMVFRVLDRGPGVPAALIGDLVKPFFRVEASRNRQTGGAGLGLSIVKDIAERHGGRLLLANRDQGGFVAELRLPLQ